MLFLYSFRDESPGNTEIAVTVPEAERELVKEIQQANAELCSPVTEQMQNEPESELQVITHSHSAFTEEFPLISLSRILVNVVAKNSFFFP